MKIYQVGGAVRDKLMGRQAHDIDYLVVGATIELMQQQGFKQVGKGFPVFINSTTKAEYALARREIKTGSKHTDFRFVFTPDITVEEDLERRDFTCNALAYDEEKNEIIDPFGGQDDIQKRLLRHINAEHFVEDPLRVLRLCRFAAQLDFEVADETMQLCQGMVATGQLNYLTPERVWAEMLKALQTPHFAKFIATARACGALAVILPEVNQLFATPERLDYHPEGNSGAHTMLALQATNSNNALINFGILLHDIGKTRTPQNILPSHHGHDKAGDEQIYNICQRLKIPHKYRDFALLCCRKHMKLRLVKQMRIATLLDWTSDIVKKGCLEEFISVCRADFLGRARFLSQGEQNELDLCITYLRHAADIIRHCRASDLPNFENLPKDQTIATRLREWQIQRLKNELCKNIDTCIRK